MAILVAGGIWNIGIQNGKKILICEELIKGMVDVCCLQEVIWR